MGTFISEIKAVTVFDRIFLTQKNGLQLFANSKNESTWYREELKKGNLFEKIKKKIEPAVRKIVFSYAQPEKCWKIEIPLFIFWGELEYSRAQKIGLLERTWNLKSEKILEDDRYGMGNMKHWMRLKCYTFLCVNKLL